MSRIFTDEHKRKLGEVRKGKKLSDKTKIKMSESAKLSENSGRFAKCQTPWNKGRKDISLCICANCGKEFYKQNSKVRASKSHYCNIECSNKRWGNPELNPKWKGGRRIYCGYCAIYKPQHPYANKAGYVYEHRLVMEEKLGRYLFSEEKIHHINGIKDDNRIDNLELWTNSHPCGQRVEDIINWAIGFLNKHNFIVQNLRRKLNDTRISP